ncbi:hypothetical protein VO226_15860 [Halomonas elongata]|uniref:hypothetical protein n=1 Tax=Halomonas elongata TaxID=2746 RepID=UPI0011AB7FE9|nr:hypothetical protein [Halomonas elongata]MBW5801805.1 hypothetical protein [Halomonas elongata]MDL4862055.1 hypothetical protein [Halomonas elongata]WVI71371.1 hypothetical protein VO226_15860 [Halomonas elongata]
MMKLNKQLNKKDLQAIGTASATLWARKTNPDATDGSNNNNDRTRWQDPNQQQQALRVETLGRHADNKNSNGDGRKSFEVNNNKNSKPEIRTRRTDNRPPTRTRAVRVHSR